MNTKESIPLPLPAKLHNDLWSLELTTGRITHFQSSKDPLWGQTALEKPLLAVVGGEGAQLKELWALEAAESHTHQKELPLYCIPLQMGSLQEFARRAFFARPPRGLQAMVAWQQGNVRHWVKRFLGQVAGQNSELVFNFWPSSEDGRFKNNPRED